MKVKKGSFVWLGCFGLTQHIRPVLATFIVSIYEILLSTCYHRKKELPNPNICRPCSSKTKILIENLTSLQWKEYNTLLFIFFFVGFVTVNWPCQIYDILELQYISNNLCGCYVFSEEIYLFSMDLLTYSLLFFVWASVAEVILRETI